MKTLGRFAPLLAVLAAMTLLPAAWARADESVTETVKALQKRLGELESARKADQHRIAVLEGKLDEKNLAKRRREDVLAVLKEMHLDAQKHQVKGSGVWSNLDIQIYGYIKADASFDTSRTSNGNFARWVEAENVNNNDDQFSLTARETRLGMKITGPQDENVRTSGVIEIDFYGTGGENSPHPRMRHAYMVIEWPHRKFSILAGQTWDVIAPLNPGTLDYTVLWWVGNVGFRRPQIRATQILDLGQDTSLKLEAAIARTIGHTAFGGMDSGLDNPYPVFEGRASVTFPTWVKGKKGTFGVSGHYGREEYDQDAAGGSNDISTWSANADLSLPVNDWIGFKGEIYTGRNMDAFVGGIGQGVDTHGSSVDGISACGGWLAVSMTPWKKWRFNAGAGVDTAHNDDLNTAGQRTVNRAIFGNAIYSINSATSVGFEISHWNTDYRNQGSADSMRFQTSFIYKF